MVTTLPGIEDAIVAELKNADEIEFSEAQILVSTAADELTVKKILATGGITVQYGGSITSGDLVHGSRLARTCTFIVSIGRKMMTERSRITHDIQHVVDVITSRPINGVRLTWTSDRYARDYNGVMWHDVFFKVVLAATT